MQGTVPHPPTLNIIHMLTWVPFRGNSASMNHPDSWLSIMLENGTFVHDAISGVSFFFKRPSRTCQSPRIWHGVGRGVQTMWVCVRGPLRHTHRKEKKIQYECQNGGMGRIFPVPQTNYFSCFRPRQYTVWYEPSQLVASPKRRVYLRRKRKIVIEWKPENFLFERRKWHMNCNKI